MPMLPLHASAPPAAIRITGCPTALIAACMLAFGGLGAADTAADVLDSDYAGQFNYGQVKAEWKDWVQSIEVIEPAYRSFVKGPVTIRFRAPGMTRAEARCWRQPDGANRDPWGHDAVVMPAKAIDGEGSFVFQADDFPQGPVNIRIATLNQEGKKDLCELQLYNEKGVQWNQGLPKTPAPAAKGMRLVFADDFNTMPTISPRGDGATYSAHKPRFGDFSGWRFSHKDDYAGAHDPFEQHGTWLRIMARNPGDKKLAGTGILSSARFDGSGIWAKAPCYFECRLTAQSAPGTWPAFWTLTAMDKGVPCDELDILEGYGGIGAKNPNKDYYHIVSHFWDQKNPDGSKRKAFSKTPPIMQLGGKSFWSTTFHTYAVKIGLDDTVYYFDDIEVLRHPSGPISTTDPAFFLINYAIGGISGWKIDLKRYGDGSDMWVDWVRVYQGGDHDLSGFVLTTPKR